MGLGGKLLTCVRACTHSLLPTRERKCFAIFNTLGTYLRRQAPLSAHPMCNAQHQTKTEPATLSLSRQSTCKEHMKLETQDRVNIADLQALQCLTLTCTSDCSKLRNLVLLRLVGAVHLDPLDFTNLFEFHTGLLTGTLTRPPVLRAADTHKQATDRLMYSTSCYRAQKDLSLKNLKLELKPAYMPTKQPSYYAAEEEDCRPEKACEYSQSSESIRYSNDIILSRFQFAYCPKRVLEAKLLLRICCRTRQHTHH